MKRSIQDVARLAGTTSRTLRHYGDIGLLEPTSIGANGYRWYDEAALVRLQRILLLRQLGLSLPAITTVLAGQPDEVALGAHLAWLHEEKARLDRQIASVEHTIRTMEEGAELMAETMFDGFDHAAHRVEVEQRWGAEAYRTSNEWWTSKTAAEKAAFADDQRALAADWVAAAARGIEATSAEAQTLAARQAERIGDIPGTPGYPSGPTKEYFVGLGELYVADPRFSANYGGEAGATFVRDAMAVYAAAHLAG